MICKYMDPIQYTLKVLALMVRVREPPKVLRKNLSKQHWNGKQLQSQVPFRLGLGTSRCSSSRTTENSNQQRTVPAPPLNSPSDKSDEQSRTPNIYTSRTLRTLLSSVP